MHVQCPCEVQLSNAEQEDPGEGNYFDRDIYVLLCGNPAYAHQLFIDNLVAERAYDLIAALEILVDRESPDHQSGGKEKTHHVESHALEQVKLRCVVRRVLDLENQTD